MSEEEQYLLERLPEMVELDDGFRPIDECSPADLIQGAGIRTEEVLEQVGETAWVAARARMLYRLAEIRSSTAQ
jgi:hypothetical protein